MDTSITVFLYKISFSYTTLQAIESFAVTVKDIAQMLQSFGTELAETKLPDEGKAIECLLESHTKKYRKLKVWLFSWKLHLLFYSVKYIFF